MKPERMPCRPGAVRATGRHPSLLLVVLCGAQFLDAVNMSSVNVALPAIQRGLGLSAGGLQWVVSAYALALAGLLLAAGRASDIAGRRRAFTAGLGLLAVFGVVAALAPVAGALVAARAGQGAGAALTVPSALAVLTTTFAPGPARSRAVAAFGAAAAAGFTTGLVYGGVIDDLLGWRWVLGLTVPAAIAILMAGLMIIPASRPDRRAAGHADIPGAICVTAGLLLLAYALTAAGSAGWASARTAGSLTLAAAFLAAFLVLQARGSSPLMPLRIWRRRNLAVVLAVAFITEVPWSGLLYFATLTMQDVLRYSPLATAMAFVPLGVGGYAFSVGAGRLLPRVGVKPLLAAGLALVTAGVAMFALVGARTSYWPLVLAALVTAGTGLAVTFVSANVAVVDGADPGEQGLIGGLFNTVLQVGSGVGVAALASIASARLHAHATGAGTLPGYHAALWTAAAVGAAGFAIVLLCYRKPRPTLAPSTTLVPSAPLHAVSGPRPLDTLPSPGAARRSPSARGDCGPPRPG